jgi:hypothetical protein
MLLKAKNALQCLVGLAAVLGIVVLVEACGGSNTAHLSETRATASPTSASQAETGAKTPTAAISTADEAFTDVFAYCGAVVTIDKPDSRWAGPALPDQIVAEIRRRAKAPAYEPRGESWRCMDGHVLVCGPFFPCGPADASREPTGGMIEFCAENPGQPILAWATPESRNTIYTWKCVGLTPEIDRQMLNVDDRGFIDEFWSEITP